MTVIIILYMLVLFAGGLGYFTIWRLTDKTERVTSSYADDFLIMRADILDAKAYRQEVTAIIKGLDKRLVELETEIKLQKADSSRLIEWLDKEETKRKQLNDEFIKSLKITERESKIIELGERLKLITTKK